VLPQVSQRRVCQVLAVARSAVRRPVLVDRRRAGRVNEHLVTGLAALIQRHPTFGYRRLWAILRFRDGQRITPKTVYRICALKRWFVHQRLVTPRPRDQSGGAEQRAVGRRSDARVLRARWLGPPGGGDRLP
jgi:putative transposase